MCVDRAVLFRFDYRGCGESEGDLRTVTYSDWRDDALAVLDQLTAGPQVLFLNKLPRTHTFSV